jgi:6-phosphogluconolactonase
MLEYLFDDRRLITLPGNYDATIEFCVHNWISKAREAILDHGFFAVALSGGSTPKTIYEKIVHEPNVKDIEWKKIYFFWSDERSVPVSHSDSNFHMAMHEAGLFNLPIPKENVFRMIAESEIEMNAKAYEELILEKLGGNAFDLIMLGIGEDGHTASLFPHTKAIEVEGRLVVANYVPQKKTWRMTFTYECINSADQICIYALGKNKSEIIAKVLTSPYDPLEYPIQKIGTNYHKALWIMDDDASKNILPYLD